MKLRVVPAVLFVLVAACGDNAATTSPATTSSPVAVAETAATPTTGESTEAGTTTAPSTVVAQSTTTPSGPIVVEVSFTAGDVVGPERVDAEKGDTISLVVTSDVAEEVHIHGYDLFSDIEAGGTVTLEFEASIQGIFEVELENSGTELIELKVS